MVLTKAFFTIFVELPVSKSQPKSLTLEHPVVHGQGREGRGNQSGWEGWVFI